MTSSLVVAEIINTAMPLLGFYIAAHYVAW